MLQNCAAVVCTLALFFLPGVGRTQDKSVRVADIPRAFQGEFKWMDGGEPFTLTLKIDKIEKKEGEIHFSGSHLYTPGDYKMKIGGRIDTKTRRILIWEYEASAAGSEIDGSFEGTISTDLKSIEAEWTSRATGKKGNLKVRVKSGK